MGAGTFIVLGIVVIVGVVAFRFYKLAKATTPHENGHIQIDRLGENLFKRSAHATVRRGQYNSYFDPTRVLVE